MDIDNATRVTTTVVDGIPGYRISRLLDQGGMGGVYLAEDETLKRLVAIKVINPDLTENTEFKQRFTTEALIIAGFQHANIVTIFASGWLGPKQYFVMEYVSGGTLKQRLDAGRLPPHEAYRIAQQMADALAYSHHREVIHRDFKPNNVLLRENGTPVLSDFGIAKSVVIDGAKTAIGVVVGSALYMAPEQALGAEISNRVDIYSFGLVLHQMLAGELPNRHPIRSRDDARHLARSLRTVDPACIDLIARCLRVSPEERPTAVECRDVLASLTRRLAPRRPSRPLPLLAAAAALVAVVAVAAAWRLGYLGARSATAPPLVVAAAAPPPITPAADIEPAVAVAEPSTGIRTCDEDCNAARQVGAHESADNQDDCDKGYRAGTASCREIKRAYCSGAACSRIGAHDDSGRHGAAHCPGNAADGPVAARCAGNDQCLDAHSTRHAQHCGGGSRLLRSHRPSLAHRSEIQRS